MKNFNRDSRSDGARGDKRRDFDGNNGQRPGMHKTVCSQCGKECEVPFRPTGERPVYCSACFEKHGPQSSSQRPRRDFQRPSFDNKRMFEAICDKCGNKCEVPFRPSGGKPVYCSQCFDRGNSAPAKAPDQFKQQFEILNSKLDKILKALAITTTAAVQVPKPKEEKPLTEVKNIKAKKTSAKPATKKTNTKKSKAQKK